MNVKKLRKLPNSFREYLVFDPELDSTATEMHCKATEIDDLLDDSTESGTESVLEESDDENSDSSSSSDSE